MLTRRATHGTTACSAPLLAAIALFGACSSGEEELPAINPLDQAPTRPPPPRKDAGADAAPAASSEPPPEPPPEPDADDGFDARWEPLSAELRARMTGASWRPGCPVGLDELVRLDIPHFDLGGTRVRGEMVVAASVAEAVLAAFRVLHAERFPVARMRLVEFYDADDDLSMAANNTSAFNCRAVTGGSTWSAHSYGTAIDINPLQNPYVRGNTVLPPGGIDYLDRTRVRSGMATEESAPVRAFDSLEWGWGGRWTSLKDYQHFSLDDR